MIGRIEEFEIRLRGAAAASVDGRDDLLALAREILDHALEGEQRERRLRETVHLQNREFEDKILELSILKRLGDLVAGAPSLENLLERVLDVLVRELRVDRGSIMLLDRKTGELSIDAGFGKDTPPGTAVNLRIGEGIAGCAAAAREVVIVPDVSRDVRYKPGRTGGEVRGALLCVPLLADERVLGVLNLSTPEVGAFTQGHVRILRIAAGQIASALVGRDLHRELEVFSDQLEATVEERTRELSRKTDDLGRKNDQITDLYLSLEETREELEKRNRALVEASAFNESIMETVNVGIGVFASDGRIAAWNRAMGAITDGLLPKEKVLGRSVDEIPANVRADFALDRPLADALRSGKATLLRDHQVELPTGRILHVNVHHIPVSIDDVGNKDVITVIEDVTDNVELHEQQMKAERLAAVTATAVGVNHEVNNPLAVILGYVQMLLRAQDEAGADASVDVRSMRKLRQIEKEAIRIREITRKLATLAEPVVVPYPSSEGGVRMVDVSKSR